MHVRAPSWARFSRNAWLLIVVSGVLSVSFYGIHTLLRVLYLLRLGHGPEYIGVYSASSALMYMVMGVPSGALGQRLGARNTMLLGAVIVVVGMIVLPLVESVPATLYDLWPIASQILLTTGWSMVNVNIIPGVVAVTAPENRSRAYSVNGAARSLGTLTGTLVGGLLPGLFADLIGGSLDTPDPYRYGLWVAAAVSAVAIVPIALLRVARPATTRARVATDEPFPVGTMVLIIGHIMLVHGGWATLQSFGSAYMDTDLRLTASAIGLITAASQVVATGAALLTPRIARRAGHGWTLVGSGVGMGLSLLPLALVSHWTTAAVGRIGNLGLQAMWLPALQVFQMERVGERWRPVAYGMVNMAMGLSFGIIGLVGGRIITTWGYQSIFMIGTGLSISASALMWRMAKGERALARCPVPTPGETPAV